MYAKYFVQHVIDIAWIFEIIFFFLTAMMSGNEKENFLLYTNGFKSALFKYFYFLYIVNCVHNFFIYLIVANSGFFFVMEIKNGINILISGRYAQHKSNE